MIVVGACIAEAVTVMRELVVGLAKLQSVVAEHIVQLDVVSVKSRNKRGTYASTECTHSDFFCARCGIYAHQDRSERHFGVGCRQGAGFGTETMMSMIVGAASRQAGGEGTETIDSAVYDGHASITAMTCD